MPREQLSWLLLAASATQIQDTAQGRIKAEVMLELIEQLDPKQKESKEVEN